MQLFKRKPKIHPSGKPIAKYCFTCTWFQMNLEGKQEGNRGCKFKGVFVRQIPNPNTYGTQKVLIWREGQPCPAWKLAEDWQKRDLGLFGAVR